MTDKTFILGHDKQRELLKDMVAANQLPSALLFAGAAGIGKSLVARELAQTLFCDNYNAINSADLNGEIIYGGCGRCHTCHLFSIGNMPDYYQIECLDRDNWNIQRIRELLYSLHLKAFSGRSRVILFNDAEHLSDQAANALLKALEEPRPNTFFVLVASGYSKLPSTITSRCQVWYFDSLPEHIIIELIHRKTGSFAEKISESHINDSELAKLADGSIGTFEKIVNSIDSWESVKKKLDLICSEQPELAANFAQELGKNKEQLRTILQLLRIRGRTKMVETSSARLRGAWANFLTNLMTGERLIFERNLNAGYILHFIFATIASAHNPDEYPDAYLNEQLLDQIV